MRHRLRRLIIFLIGLMTIVIGVSAEESTEYQKVKNVVVFNSYHDGLKWTDDLMLGLVEGISSTDVELYVEYMDSYRTVGQDNRSYLFEYYKNRYKDIDVDLVVVADNYAYDFMSIYYDELFDGVPVVFGGINNFNPTTLFTDNATGLAQTSNYNETIDLILKLHPNTRRIIAIGGKNATSSAETIGIIEVGKKDYPNLRFDKVISNTIEDQLKDLESVGPNTVMMIAGTMPNDKGVLFDHSEYAGAIIDGTGLPVYAMASVYIDPMGAVGGYVVDPYVHGFEMGTDVQKILDGVSPKDILMNEKPPSTYQFEYRRLKEFDILKSSLPEGSIVLNQSDNAIVLNRNIVMLSIGVFFLLLLIIIILTVNIRRRIMAEDDLSKQNDIFHFMAFHDSVTNLYNRKYIVEHLQKHLLEPENEITALYDVDIVNIKTINDTYGHDVGDRVTRQIANILRKTFSKDNECVGFYNTEFLIVDSNVANKEEAIERAYLVMSLIACPIEVDYMEIDIKVNIGIAMSPEHSTDSKLLLKKANIALIESLKSGPDQLHYFEDTLYKDVLKRIAFEKQLRRAVKYNEFVLYYQPKINIRTMKVDGCEALIRWNHPDGHVVYPNDFIPLAEDVGFIEEIGKWVVEETARQVKEWEDIGHRIRVSLNVSGKEFDDEFINNLARVLKEQGTDPSLLEVEITETAALKDIEHSRHLVQVLHELGLSVSLDDFGTGYSSMVYIKQLKASKLKIDKSFIDDLSNYEQKVVIDSMIQLGKKLDYSINIEGVETAEQLRILKYLGADEVQGWLFSKAITAEAFLEFVIAFDGKLYD